GLAAWVLSERRPLIGPPVALALAAICANVSGGNSPALEPAGRASPLSQVTASGSIFQILAARSRSVWITCSVALVTTSAEAKVTRLPPVSAAKGMLLGPRTGAGTGR